MRGLTLAGRYNKVVQLQLPLGMFVTWEREARRNQDVGLLFARQEASCRNILLWECAEVCGFTSDFSLHEAFDDRRTLTAPIFCTTKIDKNRAFLKETTETDCKPCLTTIESSSGRK